MMEVGRAGEGRGARCRRWPASGWEGKGAERWWWETEPGARGGGHTSTREAGGAGGGAAGTAGATACCAAGCRRMRSGGAVLRRAGAAGREASVAGRSRARPLLPQQACGGAASPPTAAPCWRARTLVPLHGGGAAAQGQRVLAPAGARTRARRGQAPGTGRGASLARRAPHAATGDCRRAAVACGAAVWTLAYTQQLRARRAAALARQLHRPWAPQTAPAAVLPRKAQHAWPCPPPQQPALGPGMHTSSWEGSQLGVYTVSDPKCPARDASGASVFTSAAEVRAQRAGWRTAEWTCSRAGVPVPPQPPFPPPQPHVHRLR